MKKNYLLTKSKYIRGLQCVKALYFDVYHPNWAYYDAETLARFRGGRDFEAGYKATYPTGIAVDALLKDKRDRYPKETARLLQQAGEVVLFEAGFLYNEVLVLADVVRKSADGAVEVFEVKASSAAKEVFLNDIAVQHYVIANSLAAYPASDVPLRLTAFNLVYNDGNGGFITESHLHDAQQQIDTVARNIETFKQALHASEPPIPMGDHCSAPYECPYKHHCQGTTPTALPLFSS